MLKSDSPCAPRAAQASNPFAVIATPATEPNSLWSAERMKREQAPVRMKDTREHLHQKPLRSCSEVSLLL